MRRRSCGTSSGNGQRRAVSILIPRDTGSLVLGPLVQTASVTVDEMVQEYVLGRLDARALPDVATAFLLSGIDTLEMASAAMPDTADPREVRELFEAALTSAGLALPTWEEAAMGWMRREARLAVSGQASIDGVAARICSTVGWPGDADSLPTPCVDVVIAASEDYYPGWRDAFMEALRALDSLA